MPPLPLSSLPDVPTSPLIFLLFLLLLLLLFRLLSGTPLNAVSRCIGQLFIAIHHLSSPHLCSFCKRSALLLRYQNVSKYIREIVFCPYDVLDSCGKLENFFFEYLNHISHREDVTNTFFISFSFAFLLVVTQLITSTTTLSIYCCLPRCSYLFYTNLL